MKIPKPLRLKKFLRDHLGYSLINQYINELFAEKLDYEDYKRIQKLLGEITDALNVLTKMQPPSPTLKLLQEKVDEIRRINDTSHEAINVDSSMIFLCGLHRSGTSLLTRVLKGCEDIGGFEGTRAIEDEGQHLQSVYPTDRELGYTGSFGFNPEAHLTESSNLTNEARRRKLTRQWSRYLPPNKKYYLEKSPPNLLKTRFLQKVFPNSKFIIIKRHPIAVSLSTAKWNPSWLPSLIRHWIHCHEIWEKDRNHIKEFLELSYEDFINHPWQNMEKIGDFMGIDNLASRCLSGTEISIKTRLNERYFSLWKSKRAERWLSQLLYERRTNKQGYSLYVE